MKKILTYLFFILCCRTIVAQLVPVRDFRTIRNIEKSTYNLYTENHSNFKPFYFSDFKEEINDSSEYLHGYPALQYKANLKRQKFGISLLPVYDAFYGLNISDFDNNPYFLNVGALVDIALSDKIGISYLFKTCYFNLPDYMLTTTFGNPIINEYGNTYSENTDFAYNHDFRVTYLPFEFLKLEIANSKNFYGDGYRSFFLSDNAKNYPYFKLETQFLDIKYSCVWAMQDYYALDSSLNIYNKRNKFSVFHYIDWKIGKRFSLGLFEAIITKNDDFLNFEYFNPIIFFRPVEFSLGSEDNALLGISMRYSLMSKSALYFQWVLDDVVVSQLLNDIKHTVNKSYTGQYGWFANKWALQLGVKSFDFLKIENLDVFTEINIARPYLYSHYFPEQNYTHNGQSLAHPLGANFVESVTGINYFHKEKFNINVKFMYAVLGMDTVNTHFGQNIFLPTMDGVQLGWSYQVQSYYNTILQGNKTNIITSQIEFSYFLKGNRNLALNCGTLLRAVNPQYGEKQFLGYFYIGIKTAISNLKRLY